MTHSPLINGIQLTSDSSSRGGARVDRFILHHAATTSLAAILSLFQPGGRTVSANYALGNDGTLILAVDEDRRAWTSSSSHWDGRAVTIEVANSVAGGSWPVSNATFDKLARLIADVATRYQFPINDDFILTHQELYIRYGASYATACPGDMQRRKGELLALARRYQAGGFAPEPPAPPKPKEFGMAQRMYFARVRNVGTKENPTLADDGEWMIAGIDLFEDLNNDPAVTGYYTRPGYWVTTNKEVARTWARQYSFAPHETLSVQLERPAYIKQQDFAKADHVAYVEGLRAVLGVIG